MWQVALTRSEVAGLALLRGVQNNFRQNTRMDNETKISKRISKPNFLLNPLIAAFLAIASTAAIADQFYVTLEVQCNPSKAELEIFFRGYWNEAGVRAIALAGNDIIDPRTLVTFTQDIKGQYSVHTRSISKKCTIGKKKYEINVAPLMAPRFHPEGFCAERIGVTATVKERGKLVVNEGVDACTEKGLVTTEVLLTPDKPVSTKKIPAEEFYAD